MPDPLAAALSQPFAQRLQGETDPIDYTLTDSARLLHPTARWWWGVRSASGGKYAACYLCGIIIDALSSAGFPPARVQASILEHRHTEAVRHSLTAARMAGGGSAGGEHTERRSS